MACRPGDHTLVKVRTFLDEIERDLAKRVLEAAGIECVVRANDLLVRADDAQRAAGLVSSASSR
jgi:hypothetical protein